MRPLTKKISRAFSEASFKELCTVSVDMHCIAGYDGYFKVLNPAWQRTLGWTEKEMLSKPYADFIHPEDREKTLGEVKNMLKGEKSILFRNRYRCKNGKYKWLEWTGVADPKKRLLFATARDCTERKKMEEDMRRDKLFLHSIVENIPAMIFVKEAKNLRFVLFNNAAEKLVGYSRERLIGKNDYDFFPKEQADFFTGKDQEVLRGKRLVDIPEEPLQTKRDGIRYLHTKKVPLVDEQGMPRYLLGISEDITKAKQLEIARSGFIAMISHQLRTPLTTLRWTLDLLKEELPDATPRQRKLLHEGQNAAAKLRKTIETILRVSSIESGMVRIRARKIPLRPLLRKLQADYAEECAEAKLNLDVNCPPLLRVNTDPKLLLEILDCLLHNALRYTPANGSIRVAVRVSPNKKKTQIMVADTGIGVPSHERENIFSKLFRGKQAMRMHPDGLGSTLFIASSLAGLLGGNLSLSAGKKRGSVFVLSLS